MAAFLRQVWAIARKDVALELRQRETLAPMLAFALIVLFVFSFSFELRAGDVRAVAPGVLWVTFTFAGMLGLGRSFVQERDQGCLDGLLLCPVERGAIYLGKMLGNWLFITAVEAIVLPLYGALFNLPLQPWIGAVALLGTLGFAAVGSLFSAMSVHVRAREVMLPVLLFPVVIPALIAAVRLTGALLDGWSGAEMGRWWQLLLGFDVIFLTLGYLLFDYVVEE